MSWWFLRESDLSLLFRVCCDSVYRLWLWSYWTCFFMINQFLEVIFFGFGVFGQDWTEGNFPCTNFICLKLAWNSIVRNQGLTLNPKAVRLVLVQIHHGWTVEFYCKERLHVCIDWYCWLWTIQKFQYHKFQECQRFLREGLIAHPQWPNCFQ